METIITFVVIVIVLRLLRRKWVWIDYILFILIIVGTATVWNSDGAIAGIVMFFILAAIVGTLVMGKNSKVNLNGKEYDIECENCGYNKPEVLSKEKEENGDVAVLYHCPRCDTTRVWVFGKRK